MSVADLISSVADQLSGVRASMVSVIEQTKTQGARAEEPLNAVIQGVDDAWEVCLLNFTVDLIERSSGGNLGDFRRHGLM